MLKMDKVAFFLTLQMFCGVLVLDYGTSFCLHVIKLRKSTLSFGLSKEGVKRQIPHAFCNFRVLEYSLLSRDYFFF